MMLILYAYGAYVFEQLLFIVKNESKVGLFDSKSQGYHTKVQKWCNIKIIRKKCLLLLLIWFS